MQCYGMALLAQRFVPFSSIQPIPAIDVCRSQFDVLIACHSLLHMLYATNGLPSRIGRAWVTYFLHNKITFSMNALILCAKVGNHDSTN